MAISDWLGLSGLVGGGLAVANAYNRLGDIGDEAQPAATAIGEQAQQATNFRPFGITSSLGNTRVDSTGGYNMSLSPEQQAQVNQMQSGASQFYNQAMNPNNANQGNINTLQGMLPGQMQYADPQSYERMADLKKQAYSNAEQFNRQAMQGIGSRQNTIYGQIRATQRPEEERQRLELEGRLNAQGRGGITSAQFGGTPEQLAMAKAQAEAQNSASYQARNQALGERQQDASLGSMYGQMGYQGTQGQSALGTQGLNNILGMMNGMAGLRTQDLNQQMGYAGIGNQMLNNQYLPYAQQLNMLQQGGVLSNIANTNVRQGAGLFADAAMGGLESRLGAGLGQANLMGNLGTGLISGSLNNGGSWIDNLLGI